MSESFRSRYLNRETAIPLLLAVFLFAVCMSLNLYYRSPFINYLHQADSMLKGRLDTPREQVMATSLMDYVIFNGKYYWSLPPLPAIVFLPFVALFGPNQLIQICASLLAAFGVFVCAMTLAKTSGFGRAESLWLAIAYCFSSVVVGVMAVNGPWYLVHLLTSIFFLSALIEYKRKKRWPIIGLLVALSIITRPTIVILGAIFFLIMICLSSGRVSNKIRSLVGFCLPILVVVALILLYNYLRFGNPFFNAYHYSYLKHLPFLLARRETTGLFDVSYAWTNVYWYFFKMPDWVGWMPVVNPWGVSFFLLSPVFVAALRPMRRNLEWLAALVTVLAFLAALMAYYTTGFSQFGPRYMIDLMPFLFFMLASFLHLTGFGRWFKVVIAGSAAVNVFLLVIFIAYHGEA